MPKTYVSPDGKRAVTVAEDAPETFPIMPKLRHIVAADVNGVARVWQVSTREAARIIVRAYKKRGHAATYIAPPKAA